MKSHAELVGMLNTQFVVPYTFKGKYNGEIVRIIQSIQKNFLAVESFIGIIPMGSQMKGYSLEKGSSDLDVSFLGGDGTNASRLENQRIMNELGREIGIPINIFEQYSSSSFTINSQAGGRSSWYHVIHPLLRPIIGSQEKILILRKMARRRVLQAGQTLFQEEMNRTLYYLLSEDFGGVGAHLTDPIDTFQPRWSRWSLGAKEEPTPTLVKMLRRGFTREEINDIFQARKKMWQGRIQHFLDATGPFRNLLD